MNIDAFIRATLLLIFGFCVVNAAACGRDAPMAAAPMPIIKEVPVDRILTTTVTETVTIVKTTTVTVNRCGEGTIETDGLCIPIEAMNCEQDFVVVGNINTTSIPPSETAYAYYTIYACRNLLLHTQAFGLAYRNGEYDALDRIGTVQLYYEGTLLSAHMLNDHNRVRHEFETPMAISRGKAYAFGVFVPLIEAAPGTEYFMYLADLDLSDATETQAKGYSYNTWLAFSVSP